MESLTGRARPGGLVCAPGLTASVLYHKPRKKTRREVRPLCAETESSQAKGFVCYVFVTLIVNSYLEDQRQKQFAGLIFVKV